MLRPRFALLALFLVAACSPPQASPGGGAFGNLTPDAGPAEPAQCLYPDGRICGNSGCPSLDGCNWCDCANPGGRFGCTQVRCAPPGGTPADGAPAYPRCRTAADCPGQAHCVFRAGCEETLGYCVSVDFSCRGPGRAYCDCQGRTRTTADACGAEEPFTKPGSC